MERAKRAEKFHVFCWKHEIRFNILSVKYMFKNLHRQYVSYVKKGGGVTCPPP